MEKVKEKNECGKTRPISNPYEVWRSLDGQWTWKVLKKYQRPTLEAKNPYARWFMATSSPYVKDELGDGYVRDVKANAIRIS